ncbi:MAG: 3-oxoacyl-[acyl-carrier-protein] synthase 2 [Myxococcaceae bacterium]|nr:3-oxoacyl-[acyl-carrier-protein] synthase 2 [Myxococcaceae bacterium]
MRRVVVTGLGAVSPTGLDAQTSFRAVVEGQSGIAAITAFDTTGFACTIAGECKGFDPEHYMPKKEVRTMDRFIHLAVAAAQEALRSAGIEAFDDAMKERTGVILGVGIGGLSSIESTYRVLTDKGPSRISPYFIPATICNLAPGQISIRHGLRGTNYAIISACASGAHAIGEAFRGIARGDFDACVAGGTEAAVTPLGVGGFAAMRALTRRNDAPTAASRPWDQGRDGFIISEGSGLLFIEEREQALRRGATILAEVVGYGASADAFHLTQPAPEGEGAQRAMRAALADAKLAPTQIDYVNAHGTSTPVGDVLELLAARAVFGDHATHGLWISSTKSVTGHLLGAAGGLEAVFSVLALRDGVVPPTLNLDNPVPEAAGLDLVPGEARRRALSYVLSNSFGFGGTNASLIFAKA